MIESLFAPFNQMLEERGIITNKGTIADDTFVDALRQRNTREENQKIKNSEIPEEWDKNPHPSRRKALMRVG